jgi:two-component system, sensor histidine kinase PdtaS
LQHRVSNNLQVVSALLALQRRRISDTAAAAALDDAAGRIALIGKISRGLYSAEQTRQTIASLLRNLTEDTLEAAGRADVQVRLESPEEMTLHPDAVVPFALSVAEAVNNAVEHAFADDRPASLSVTVTADRANIATVAITDNGPGLSPDFSQSGNANLGLRIARTLMRQIKGEFYIESLEGGGTRVRIVFPLDE